MATNLLCWWAVFFLGLAGPGAAYHCMENCDSEGLFPEELLAEFLPVEQFSHCANPVFCDDSSSGTGHLLYGELTEDVIAVERCFSYCFNSSYLPEGKTADSEDILDDTGDNCLLLQESFVCFSACLFMRRLEGLKTAPSLYALPANAPCKDFCTVEGGICDRAFSPDTSMTCMNNCDTGLCETMCETLDQQFPANSTPQAQSVPTPSGNLSLQLARKYDLRKQGVLEISSTGRNDTAMTYGLIWKVEVNDSSLLYIPQHLPFHFLPMEVGPLYRVGSNMLSIRQLQCLQGVKLSYALVNGVGLSEFSEPQEQCFYGNDFLQPPSDLHISIGFVPLSSELWLKLEADTLSQDQEHVTGYEARIYTDGDDPRADQTYEVEFPDEDHLSVTIKGNENVFNVFPLLSFGTQAYWVTFYALPWTSVTATGRHIQPAANWIRVTPNIPDYPAFNGTPCYILTQDRRVGMANASFQLSLHSGWKSLAPVASVQGILSLREPVSIPGLPTLPTTASFPVKTYMGETHMIENLTQSEYAFNFDNVLTTSGERFYEFTIILASRFVNHQLPNPASETTASSILLPALPPLPVRDLQVCYVVESGSLALLTVTWLPPEGGRKDLTYQVNASREGVVTNTMKVNPTDVSAQLSANLPAFLPTNDVQITVLAMTTFGVTGVPSVVTLNLAKVASDATDCVAAVGSSVNQKDDVISVVSNCVTVPPTNSGSSSSMPTAAILFVALYIQGIAVM